MGLSNVPAFQEKMTDCFTRALHAVSATKELKNGMASLELNLTQNADWKPLRVDRDLPISSSSAF